ncbi:hypothetical protein H5410_064359 [Solanum commersonii]|uniref:Poly A polymerase head domain-containing protein n=1 Tax=Solanum commersonii TaxID=4109 RepID=A0A9J5VZK3_SOLCO|nr:hypothetical protein H5410_064359 [Solanum commersonii]
MVFGIYCTMPTSSYKGSIWLGSSKPDQSNHLETARMRLFDVWIDFVNLRAEDYSENSRIPTMICKCELDEDHRDLTINSLFCNINTKSVKDLRERGIADLKSGKIVTPLPPKQTFLDDPLRVLELFILTKEQFSRYRGMLEVGSVMSLLGWGLLHRAPPSKQKRPLATHMRGLKRGFDNAVIIIMILDDWQPVKFQAWIYNPLSYRTGSNPARRRGCIFYVCTCLSQSKVLYSRRLFPPGQIGASLGMGMTQPHASFDESTIVASDNWFVSHTLSFLMSAGSSFQFEGQNVVRPSNEIEGFPPVLYPVTKVFCLKPPILKFEFFIIHENNRLLTDSSSVSALYYQVKSPSFHLAEQLRPLDLQVPLFILTPFLKLAFEGFEFTN